MNMYHVTYHDKRKPGTDICASYCYKADGEDYNVIAKISDGCEASVLGDNTRQALETFWSLYDEFCSKGRKIVKRKQEEA